MSNNLYDCIIIGGGPSGLAAGIYSARARLKTILFEKASFGGQISITDEIANYPGFYEPNEEARHPKNLINKMIEQAKSFGFAESDLIHKAQVGYKKEDIVAGLCKSIVLNYLNNVGKGKKIKSPVIFQGGVSKNLGVLKYFKEILNTDVIVDSNSHLMGALGIAILAKKNSSNKIYDLNIQDVSFDTKAIDCGGCSNNCEILRIYKNNKLIDIWGNRCDKYIKN